MQIYKFLNYCIATGFGTGLAPKMPGTVGSAFAVLLVWLAFPSLLWAQIALVVGTSLLGVWTSQNVSTYLGVKDPSMVVIDEIAGIFVCFLLVPVNIWTLIIGFLLFRLFDIWKPGPIGALEKLPGGWGIMLDDLLCGVFVNVLFQILMFWKLL